MNSFFLIPTLHFLFAIVEFELAALVWLADRKAILNRLVSAVAVVLGLTSLGVGAVMNSISLQEAAPWLQLLTATTYMLLPTLFYASAAALRPQLASKRWFTWLLLVVIVIPPLAVLMDVVGASQSVLGQPLIYQPPDVGDYTGGYIATSDFVGGLLNSVLLNVIYAAAFAILGLCGLVFWRDRKVDRTRARMAMGILLATLAATFVPAIAPASLQAGVSPLITNLVFAAAFVYVSLRSEPRGLNVGRFLAGDLPMFQKLTVSVAGLLLPATLVVALSAVTFYKFSILNLTGDGLRSLAEAEADNIEAALAQQAETLTTLGSDPLHITLITGRDNGYLGLTDAQVADQISEIEDQWQAGDEPVVGTLLAQLRWASLQSFVENSPAYSQLLLADQHGALITATYRPASYDQSESDWWQAVSASGEPFVGLPRFEATLGEYVVDIAVPIFIPDQDGRADAVLAGVYSLSGLSTEVNSIQDAQVGSLGLFTHEGEWIPYPEAMTEQTPEVNWDRLLAATAGWDVLPYADESSVVAWAEVTPQPETGQSWRVLAHRSVPQALAGVVAARWVGVLTVIIIVASAILVAGILARAITRPLGELTLAAESFMGGELESHVAVESRDEIGALAATFNNMTERLRLLVRALETTTARRTAELERWAAQLETAAAVAHEAAAIREPQLLLNQVVQLISERFGFYHAGIFLLDTASEYAVLQAASSPGGQRMLNRGHKLQVGKVGVVGYAAGTGEARLAQDVGADVVYYDNPDMPDTRSELALPLTVRERVIGVLDVQARETNAFTKEDTQALQTLADQLALAIENARLLQGSQKALEELESVYGEEIGQAWRARLEQRPVVYRYRPAGVDIVPTGGASRVTGSLGPLERALTKKISLRGQEIGGIELRRAGDQPDWSEEEKALVEEIMEQTALALENARLVDQIRLRSDQIQLLQEITALGTTLMDQEELLQGVAEKLQTGLDLVYCSVSLFDENLQTGEIVAAAPRQMTEIDPRETSFQLENHEVTLEVIRRRENVVLYDIEANALAASVRAPMLDRGTHTLILIPLIVRGRVIGAIQLEVAEPERKFELEDLGFFDQISAQVATSMDATRLMEETSRRADRERLVAEITTKVRASNDPQVILQTAVSELRQALGAHRAQVLLESNEREARTNGEPSPNGEGNGTSNTTDENAQASRSGP